jgi:hypothetical protein
VISQNGLYWQDADYGIAWVVLSEVVPPEARTAVGSVAVSINWLTNFTAVSILGTYRRQIRADVVQGSSFLPLQQSLKKGERGEGNVFYVFSAASLVAGLAILTSYRLYDRRRARRMEMA